MSTVFALVSAYTAPEEDEETLKEDDWQISCLVSAATYTAEPDAGRVMTGRIRSHYWSQDGNLQPYMLQS